MLLSSCRRAWHSRRFRWTVRILFLAAILLAIAAVLFPQYVLTIDNGPVQADAIIVLGGAPHDRAERAAELFNDGDAPRIIASGTGDDRRNKRILLQAGVPADAIHLESESFTTRENAQFTIPLLRALGAKRVIIVTSWFHSRRALRTFQHYGSGIQFFSRPSYYGYPGKIPDYALTSIAAYKRSHDPSSEVQRPFSARQAGAPNSKSASSDRPPSDLRPRSSDGASVPASHVTNELSTIHHPLSGVSNAPPSGPSVPSPSSLVPGPADAAPPPSASRLPLSPSRQMAAWRDVRGYVKSEYIKLIGYWFYYGVCPL